MDEEPEVGRRTSRRAFLGGRWLGGTLVAAAARRLAGEVGNGVARKAAAGPAAAVSAEPSQQPLPAAPGAPAAADGFELAEATLAELQAALAAGRRTSRGLVEAYLARIAALDRRRPELRALLDINPQALATPHPPAAAPRPHD